MPESPKFFLGYGERLTSQISPPNGGRKTEPVYSFDEAVARLKPMVGDAVNQMNSLPELACPGNEAVGVVTLHPQWIAKTSHPAQLLREYDLRQVGSRPVEIKPDKWTRKSEPSYVASSQLFVAGSRDSFKQWQHDLFENPSRVSLEIRRLESFKAPISTDRLRNIPNRIADGVEEILLEVVLHAAEEDESHFVLDGFSNFAEMLGVRPIFEKKIQAGGLCFVPVEANLRAITELAKFAFLRVVRPMPFLRDFPSLERSVPTPGLMASPLPNQDAVDPDLRIAVFDGGLRGSSPFGQWATSYQGNGIGEETDPYLSHGHGVTSAVLFGPLMPGQPAPRPYAVVDHYRVIDAHAKDDPYELYDVLRRVDEILRTHEYQLFNLSIGPGFPIEDDEVHSWTALLDQHLSDGRSLATIAVGNSGREDRGLGEARIQPPSDSVNGLSVGATDTRHQDWKRAAYSSFGPGRSPGVIKPDVVQFGGFETEPFLVYDQESAPALAATCGTSFASPSVLRLASGVRAHFGSRINPLALKALLVHSADPLDHHHDEVGWGRVSSDITSIVVCDEGMVRVVYQGELNPGQYWQALIPTPAGQMTGNVTIKATFCYATPTDPQDPGSYTRSGLEVTFRPHAQKFDENASLAKTKSFFRKSYFGTEQALRNDAQKWETTLNAKQTFRASSLLDPILNIHYNARTSGGAARNAEKMRYALVVTVHASRVPDLYDQVVRAFAGRLEPLLPLVEIPIRV